MLLSTFAAGRNNMTLRQFLKTGIQPREGNHMESKILSRRQAVAGLGLFGLFMTAPTLFGSDKAEAKAIDAAAEAAARAETEAEAIEQDKLDEVELAQAEGNAETATDFSSQYYYRRRRYIYRPRYFVVRRRYWRRRLYRRRRYW